MTKLVAICAIVRTPTKSSATEFAGFDEDGNSIIQAISEEVKPGTIFEEPNEVEAEWLLEHNAARIPTDRELQLFQLLGELPVEGGK